MQCALPHEGYVYFITAFFRVFYLTTNIPGTQIIGIYFFRHQSVLIRLLDQCPLASDTGMWCIPILVLNTRVSRKQFFLTI